MYVKKRNVRSNVILFYICSPILTEDQEFHAISSLDLFRILTSEASESSENFPGTVLEASESSRNFSGMVSEASESSRNFPGMVSEVSESSKNFSGTVSETSEVSRNFSGMVSEQSEGYSRHILPLSSSIDLDMRVVLTAPLGFS